MTLIIGDWSMKRIMLAAIAVTMMLSGITVSSADGGTLVIATTQKPRHLNPAVQSGIATAVPGTQIFATPVRFDENWNPQPYLAESWAFSDDGMALTLNLRKGATFHDGHPITSKDVAFSIETIKANHPFKTMFGPVEAIDTPDDHTAVLRLSAPHPALLLALSSALGVIIPEHIYGDGQDPKAHLSLKQFKRLEFSLIKSVYTFTLRWNRHRLKKGSTDIHQAIALVS